MKNPLSARALAAPDLHQKRSDVEAFIHDELFRLEPDPQQKDYNILSNQHSIIDQFATAYARYRFGGMDNASLLRRYKDIVQKAFSREFYDRHKASPESTLKALKDSAEARVDDAIDRVFPEGIQNYSLLSRTALLNKNEPGLLEDTIVNIKKNTSYELSRRCQSNLWGWHIDAFKDLEQYVMGYIDSRFNKMTERELYNLSRGTITHLVNLGIDERVGFLMMQGARDIAGTNIQIYMGRGR